MSNPSSDATPGAKTGEVSFEQQVNQLASTVERGEDGKYAYPEGLTPELKTAVTAELRRRDTQSAYTTTSQKAKALEAENQRLKELLEKRTSVSLTDDQKEELETLKYEDPEAWRAKLNEYEHATKQQLSQELNEVTSSASKSGELARRQIVLEQFMEDNPGLVINDDVIANDVPPRITRKLEKGEVSFEEFLSEVKSYLAAPGFKIAGSDPDLTAKEVNLSNVGGGSNASRSAVAEDIITSYETELY